MLHPLAMMIILAVVFSHIMRIPIKDYAVFLFAESCSLELLSKYDSNGSGQYYVALRFWPSQCTEVHFYFVAYFFEFSQLVLSLGAASVYYARGWSSQFR